MSRSIQDHAKHLDMALSLLRKHSFHANQRKCCFCQTHIKFLGHVVSASGVSVDPEKFVVVRDWPRPTNVRELQSFLGFANYFRRFVRGSCTIVAPLTELTGSKSPAFDFFHWPSDIPQRQAFDLFKHALSNPPVLALPNPNAQFEIRADASLVGTGAVLLQSGRPIAYANRKFTPAQRNYTTTDQELLALYHACKEWRCYLEGASQPVLLTTDHQALVNFATIPQPSHRQSHVIQFLQSINFQAQYKPGSTNMADPISRHPTLLSVLTRATANALQLQRPTPTPTLQRKGPHVGQTKRVKSCRKQWHAAKLHVPELYRCFWRWVGRFQNEHVPRPLCPLSDQLPHHACASAASALP
jgi:hypothetical protein